MTKREICERLMNLYEGVCRDAGKEESYTTERAKLALRVAGNLRSLLLDLAAPVDEDPADKLTRRLLGLDEKAEPKSAEPKAEEKHPGVIAKPGKDGEIEFCWCQKCYAHAAVVHNPFGDGENWSYCKTCGVSFRLKCGEGLRTPYIKQEKEEPEAEEKHPGIIVDPSGKNPPRCLRCGLDAEVVSYIGRGEEWVLCPKCGCAYRIKRGNEK